jgi:hypothetical protein
MAGRLVPLAIACFACVLAACAGGRDAAVSHDAAQDPAAAEPVPKRVEPRPGMAGVHPVPFETATPIGDETALDVRFWGGVEPCFVLDGAAVAETAETVTVTLTAGYDPARPGVACIEIALWMSVEVRLAAPLGGRAIRDGAAPDPANP